MWVIFSLPLGFLPEQELVERSTSLREDFWKRKRDLQFWCSFSFLMQSLLSRQSRCLHSLSFQQVVLRQSDNKGGEQHSLRQGISMHDSHVVFDCTHQHDLVASDRFVKPNFRLAIRYHWCLCERTNYPINTRQDFLSNHFMPSTVFRRQLHSRSLVACNSLILMCAS